jgi:hypothetical protein
MPFDLDAAVAEAVATAGLEPFRFTFGGEDYELPPRMDIRALGSFTKGDVYDGLRLMLGPDQHERLLASPAVFSDDAFQKLIEAYAEHQGTTIPESAASTSSSLSTAER